MTLEEIKEAVLAGRTVHWQSESYEVVYIAGKWLIRCGRNKHCIGLTWSDNVTLNGREEDFRIKKTRAEELQEQLDKALTEWDDHYITVMGADELEVCLAVRRSAERVHELVSEYRDLRSKEWSDAATVR
jgi:hypothetical protein